MEGSKSVTRIGRHPPHPPPPKTKREENHMMCLRTIISERKSQDTQTMSVLLLYLGDTFMN